MNEMNDDYNPLRHGVGDAISPYWELISNEGGGGG